VASLRLVDVAASLAFHVLQVFLQPHQKVQPALAAAGAAKFLFNQVLWWFYWAGAAVVFHGLLLSFLFLY
jgi:hypothetical protein